MSESVFLQATRIKARFNTPNGVMMVEDLWDLPLTSSSGRANLDDIAKDLDRKIKEVETGSFVVKEKKADPELQIKFGVVKSIIDTRLAEREEAEKARVNSEKKQRLLALIAQKENEQLAGSSLEELRNMVSAL